MVVVYGETAAKMQGCEIASEAKASERGGVDEKRKGPEERTEVGAEHPETAETKRETVVCFVAVVGDVVARGTDSSSTR